MSSNPSTASRGHAATVAKYGANDVTIMGTCFVPGPTPILVEISGSKSSHEINAKAASGSDPTITFKKEKDFAADASHRYTRLGAFHDSKGFALALYDQNTNTLNIDTVS